MSTGWVYVLSNPSIPNQVQVGWTSKLPKARAEDLQSTGVPTPFKVETAMLFANKAEQIEQKTHNILRRTRVSYNREWFECDASAAAGGILKASEFFSEAVLKTDPVLLTEEDILQAKRKEEEERIKEAEERRKEAEERAVEAQNKKAEKEEQGRRKAFEQATKTFSNEVPLVLLAILGIPFLLLIFGSLLAKCTGS